MPLAGSKTDHKKLRPGLKFPIRCPSKKKKKNNPKSLGLDSSCLHWHAIGHYVSLMCTIICNILTNTSEIINFLRMAMSQISGMTLP